MKRILLFLLIFCFSFSAVAELSEKDAENYRLIFKYQEKENWQTADKAITRLKDKSLMGHVLAQRYFSKTWRTKAKEIEAWFKKYEDHPEAVKMYALGQKKKANLPPKKPKPIYGGRSGTCSVVYRSEPIDAITGLSFPYLSGEQRKKAVRMMRQIVRYLQAGRTLNAKQLIEGKDAKILFNSTDHDGARIALAFSYFLDGRDDLVIQTIDKPVKRSGRVFPLGHWTLGLSYWRMNDVEKAAYHFDKVALHEKSNPLLKSAGAYWASRANLKLGNFAVVNTYLETAAENPRTFYGLLATRALGRDLNHTWDKPVLPEDEITEEFSHPAFERVLALKQIGQESLARQELSNLFLKADRQTQALLSVVAEKNGLASDLSRVSGEIKEDTSLGRYPAPEWKPDNGWIVDKALVFAFVKQESCFNAGAKSKVGAVGLMQLMPASARHLTKIRKIKWEKERLQEPEYNLALGQEYLLFLMNDKNIQHNLLFTAAAYNSGPGNLIKLKKRKTFSEDPLLFMESIPFRETRTFVERIMANYWIYRNLMKQDLFSMDALIEGKWPVYIPQDEGTNPKPNPKNQ